MSDNSLREYPTIGIDNPLKDYGLLKALHAFNNGTRVKGKINTQQVYLDKLINSHLPQWA